MTLNNAKVGTSYTVENIDLKIDIKRHLEAIGMILNTTIEVLNKKRNGAVIFKVRGTRLAVGKNISQNITIKEIISNEWY